MGNGFFILNISKEREKMKHILILLVLFITTNFAQNVIKGRVTDVSLSEPLVAANVIILKTSLGTVTDTNGNFQLEGKFSGNDTLQISFIGYKTRKIGIEDFLKTNHIIKLEEINYKLQPVVIKGLLNKEGFTPASFSKLKRKEIEKTYTIQDLPEYLSYLPSTTFYSESGNGIGYNYLSIRGFDQRRLSISVNGIPQNDPEDHNIYWLDMPDLLESTELVQVQRGAGAGMVGYPSIGGSINIITSVFSDKPRIEFSSSVGSYNTRKYSAKFSSGLVNKKYSIYAKLSKVLSDGYRDNSWVDFNSYHISAVRYDKNLTTQINLYGGPISDGLAFYGLPKEYIKDKKLRKTNFVKPREIENFSQPHYELLNEYKINKNLTFNSALFLVIGDGFFDYDGSWSVYYDDYFRLKTNGYDSTKIPQNALIRAKVENTQWGWIPRLSWEHDNGTLIFGAEYRNHRSNHWGSINFAENLPDGLGKDYKYYFYKGGNDIFNVYANESYTLTNNINLLVEIQLAYHKYKIFDEKYVGTDFSISNLFINPRFGINYKFNNNFNIYSSFARVSREPRLKNYYDAAESSGGAVPQFEKNNNGTYNFDAPLVQPEIMNDIELGARYGNKLFSINTNLFYMLFNDEIVKKGQLDRFGQPITGNIDKTIHSGIEIEGSAKLTDNFDFIFNTTYSKNYISKGATFISYDNNSVKIDLANNKIAGFPELTMNTILKAHYKNLSSQLSLKYVGDYYSDNYDNYLTELLSKYPGIISYKDNKVDSYFVMNFMASYNFKMNTFFKDVNVFVQVNNIFDKLYAAHATGGDFFPAAERNFLIGLKLGL